MIASQLGSGQFDDETTSGDWGWSNAGGARPEGARRPLRRIRGRHRAAGQVRRLVAVALRPDPLRQLYAGETMTPQEMPGWDLPELRRDQLGDRAHGHRAGRHGDGAAERAHEPDRQLRGGHARPSRGRHSTCGTPASSAPAGRPSRSPARPPALRSRSATARSSAPTGCQHPGLHARGPDPDRLLHRQGQRHGDVHAALHLQGLPVRPDQRASAARRCRRTSRSTSSPCRKCASRWPRPACSARRATC